MKHKILTSLFYLLLLLILPLQAQVMIKAEPGKVLHIEEIQAIITEKEDAIIVEAVLPVDTRLEDYRNIQISKADTVLMANGKRIGSVKELEKMYKDFTVGQEFKLGIRGKEGLRIVAFKKADPDQFPKKKMMKMTVENENGKVTKKVVDEEGNEWTGEEAEQMIEKMKASKSEADSSEVRIEIEEAKP